MTILFAWRYRCSQNRSLFGDFENSFLKLLSTVVCDVFFIEGANWSHPSGKCNQRVLSCPETLRELFLWSKVTRGFLVGISVWFGPGIFSFLSGERESLLKRVDCCSGGLDKYELQVARRRPNRKLWSWLAMLMIHGRFSLTTEGIFQCSSYGLVDTLCLCLSERMVGQALRTWNLSPQTWVIFKRMPKFGM